MHGVWAEKVEEAGTMGLDEEVVYMMRCLPCGGQAEYH